MGYIGTGLPANGKLEYTLITPPTHPASSNNRLQKCTFDSDKPEPFKL